MRCIDHPPRPNDAKARPIAPKPPRSDAPVDDDVVVVEMAPPEPDEPEPEKKCHPELRLEFGDDDLQLCWASLATALGCGGAQLLRCIA
jgi:hypothetical protein